MEHTSMEHASVEHINVETVIKKLDEILTLINKPLKNDPYESDITNELNTALAKACGEFKPITSNRENPYFMSGYSDLNNIMLNIRPVLSKNGLSVTQRTKTIEGSTVLLTRLWHASGQWIESRARVIPTKNDIDSYGSALNYMRRFQILSLLGITVSEDPFDDDAELEMAKTRGITEKGTKLSAKYNPKKESSDTITKEQLEELRYELTNEYSDIEEDILDRLHLRDLSELPKSRFIPTINRVRKIKQLREGK